MKRKLWYLAFLILAASSLKSETEKALDLGDLARAEDRLGTSVALSSRNPSSGCPPGTLGHPMLVTGAPQASIRGSRSGAAYLFALNESGAWVRDESFPATAPDTTAFDAYGLSVAVSGDGNVVAIGAPLHDERYGNAGVVYLYEREAGAWALKQTLTAEEEAQRNDHFGTAVALNCTGEVVVVGAPQPNPFPEENPHGKAYVFRRMLSGFSRTRLSAEAGGNFDFFGFAVAVDGKGETVVVGSPGADLRGDQSGAAYRFDSRQRTPLTAEQVAAGYEFGISVAISADGSTIAVGARQHESRGPGSAYVFSAGWTQELVVQISKGLGTSVAVAEHGKFVIVGAPGSLDDDETQGSAYSFSFDNPQIPRPICSTAPSPARCGQSVAVADGMVALGAPTSPVGGAATAGSVQVLGLVLSAAVQDQVVTPGKKIHLKITVTNPSTIKLVGIQLRAIARPDVLHWEFPAGGAEEFDLEAQSSSERDFIALVNPAAEQLGLRIEVKSSNGLPGMTSLDRTPSVKPEDQLSLCKKVNKERAARGERLVYTITVKNEAVSQASGVLVRDTFDREVLRSFEWCKVSGDGACRPDTPGHIEDIVTLPPMSRLTYTVWATTATDTPRRDLLNTAELFWKFCVKAAAEESACRSSSAPTALPRADLAVTIRPDQTAVPGESADLSLRVCNPGEDAVEDARITAEIPALAGGTLTCPFGTRQDSLIFDVDLAKGQCALCSLSVPVPPHLRGTIDFKASVALPGNSIVYDPNRANDSSAAVLGLIAKSEVSIVPAALTEPVVPGSLQPRVFTFSLFNDGPSDVLEAVVEAPFPFPFTAVTWSCQPAGLCAPERGTGNLLSVLRLPANRRIDFEVRFLTDAGAVEPVTTRLVVWPSMNDAQSTALNAAITANPNPLSDLGMEILEEPAEVIPGNPRPAVYRFKVTNSGPSDSRMVRVTHDFQPDVSAVQWSCVATRGSCRASGAGEVREDVVLEAGGSALFTVRAVASPELTGSLEANARVIARGGTRDPRGENNSRALETPLKPVADLAVAKEWEGGNWRVTVFNAGPSDVVGATVRDAPPDGLAPDETWTCTALSGSCECPAGGCHAQAAGCLPTETDVSVLLGTVSLRVGGRAVFTLPQAAMKGTRNRACITAPAGTMDLRGDNNLATADRPPE